MLLTFYALIDKVPSSFWGVIFGAFFSIIGVSLTNRANDRRLRAQFENERVQKSKDREMTLKKDIYLSATEALALGLEVIGRYPNLDLAYEQLSSEYSKKSPELSKVHVIARTETVEPLVIFTSELSAAFLKLTIRRIELLGKKEEISRLEKQIVESGKERDRFLELMKQHNIEGVIDDRRSKVISDNFEFEQNRISEILTCQHELIINLFPQQIEFMRECISEYAKLSEMLIPILLAVRIELEIPFDETAYRKLIADSISKQQQAIDNFVQKILPLVDKPAIPI